MLDRIKEYLKNKQHKRKMHKQFLDIQKWQREMLKYKFRQEVEKH